MNDFQGGRTGHDKNQGIYNKYEVKRIDNTDAPGEKHDNCEYFVLDITHDPYARYALWAYSLACRDDFPTLASDLRAKLWDT